MAALGVERDGDWFIFACPHCHAPVEVHVNDVACKIFRHGFFFMEKNGVVTLTTQVPPHAPQEQCEQWAAEGKILGCGKPFKMDGFTVEVCGYI